MVVVEVETACTIIRKRTLELFGWKTHRCGLVSSKSHSGNTGYFRRLRLCDRVCRGNMRINIAGAGSGENRGRLVLEAATRLSCSSLCCDLNDFWDTAGNFRESADVAGRRTCQPRRPGVAIYQLWIWPLELLLLTMLLFLLAPTS